MVVFGVAVVNVCRSLFIVVRLEYLRFDDLVIGIVYYEIEVVVRRVMVK